MPFPLLAILLCCCRRTRTRDAESTVIPSETSRLRDPPSLPAPVVDHQTLGERLAGILCAKEEKMVSVAARTPFTIVSSHPTLSPSPSPSPSPSSSPLPSSSTRPTNGTTTINRRPPVLTMMPARARSQGSSLHLNLYADTRSHASRSSSRRRPQSAHSQSSVLPSAFSASQSPAPAPASDRGKAPASASTWFGESGSDASAEEALLLFFTPCRGVVTAAPSPSPSPRRIHHPLTHPPAPPHATRVQGITLSWGDV
ncbi:hypothetical protein DFH09DRAFT_1373964 [Mycena vulgaris]|nr:hypothetical protein DFH09DRAFT_1373964 [Mycena vulgaris]